MTETTTEETTAEKRGRRKVRLGIVTIDKMQKTIVVKVTKRFKAHDESGEARVGDTVEIAETRPLSKDKNWRLLRIVERAK
jgi:small subunit ribosomal protein S17